MEDIYALDDYTMAPLRSCPSSTRTDSPIVCLYIRDPLHPQFIARAASHARRDWLGIGASFLKLIEVFVFCAQGAPQLAILTTISWAYFVICSIGLQVLGISREYGSPDPAVNDVIVGNLPTALEPGESRKILLGVPANVRKSTPWRIVWAAGGFVCAGSLVATYMALSSVSLRCFYTWAGFQTLWLVMRSLFFHIAREAENFKYSIVQANSNQFSAISVSNRLLGLTVALSRYQMLEHPRGSYCYEDDVQGLDGITQVLELTNWRLSSLVPLQHNNIQPYDTVQIDIIAVIGDTLLSSATYLYGSKIIGMDLYDSCLVLVKTGKGAVLVPSVRVLSGAPHTPIVKDIETGTATNFVAKGCTNDGVNISWAYWIPCGPGRWLHFRTEMVSTVGSRTVTFLSDAEITQRLMSGSLLISFTSSQDIKNGIKLSTVAGEILCKLATGTAFTGT
jgi:hypothetical protein